MPESGQFQIRVTADLTASILISTTTSAEIDLAGTTLCGLHMPAAFTGTTLTFSASSASGGTFLVMQDGLGNNISKTVSASAYIALDPADFAGVRFLKIISGSTELAARSIILATRSVG